MSTTVSTTPVQLNDGTAVIVHIGNTGDPGKRVTLSWGSNSRSLDPGFSADIRPGGNPITAVTALGSTTLTVDTTGVPPGHGGGESGGGLSLEQIATGLAGTFAQKLNATTKTGAYSAAAGDFVLADATAGAFSITLPPNPTLGQQVAAKKIDATGNTVTVVAAGKTIDGDASAVIAGRWAGAIFTYDGTNWVIAAPTYAGGVSFGTSAGTAAQGNDTRITGASQKAANLSDLADLEAARNALKLGSSAMALLQLAASPDLMVDGPITRSATGAAIGFNVVWPVGGTGAFVGTESLTASGAIDSYTVTRVVSGQPTKTFTQPTLTRDGAGAVTNRPTMTVS